MVVEKGQYDHSANANDDQHASKKQSHSKQNSLEWVEFESGNGHRATHFRIRVQ